MLTSTIICDYAVYDFSNFHSDTCVSLFHFWSTNLQLSRNCIHIFTK